MRTALVLSIALLATGCRQDKMDDTEGNIGTKAAEADADGEGH